MKEFFKRAFLSLLVAGCVPLEETPADSYTLAAPEPAAMTAALGSANAQNRRNAMRRYSNALRARGASLTDDLLPPLVRGAEDNDSDVRLSALSGLAVIAEAAALKKLGAGRPFHKHLNVDLSQDERLFRALLMTLEDEQPESRLRTVAVLSAGFGERTDTEDALNRRLPVEPDARVRTKIIEKLALEPFRSPHTLLQLRAALQGPDTTVRDRAGRRLAQLRDEQALAVIVDLLSGSQARLRPDLWNVVGQFGGAAKGHLDRLRSARGGITDPAEAAVADAALRAIKNGN